MKVLNLRCEMGHSFEGWFGSEESYLSQSAQGLVMCPQCGVTQVSRMPSAPRLNLSGTKEPEHAVSSSQAVSTPAPNNPSVPPGNGLEALRAAWLKAAEVVLAHTEDVGEKFCDEARRIHYGEAEERPIRGQASAEERAELSDEGIEVMTFPLPIPPSGPKH